MTNALHQLSKYGQSYWLDNLTRRKIISGELMSCTGMTTKTMRARAVGA
jgi:hypothetical protein